MLIIIKYIFMRFFLLSILSISLLSCGTTQKTVNSTSRLNLQDKDWVMTDDSGIINVNEGDNEKPLYINFPSGQVSANTHLLGCETGNNGKLHFSNPNHHAHMDDKTCEKTGKGKMNTYTAFLGCNTISGGVSAGDQGQIKFFKGLISRRSCPDMSYEKTFIDMIGQANKYQIEDGKLHFYRNDILLMSFQQKRK